MALAGYLESIMSSKLRLFVPSNNFPIFKISHFLTNFLELKQHIGMKTNEVNNLRFLGKAALHQRTLIDKYFLEAFEHIKASLEKENIRALQNKAANLTAKSRFLKRPLQQHKLLRVKKTRYPFKKGGKLYWNNYGLSSRRTESRNMLRGDSRLRESENSRNSRSRRSRSFMRSRTRSREQSRAESLRSKSFKRDPSRKRVRASSRRNISRNRRMEGQPQSRAKTGYLMYRGAQGTVEAIGGDSEDQGSDSQVSKAVQIGVKKVTLDQLSWGEKERIMRLLYSKVSNGVDPAYWRRLNQVLKQRAKELQDKLETVENTLEAVDEYRVSDIAEESYNDDFMGPDDGYDAGEINVEDRTLGRVEGEEGGELGPGDDDDGGVGGANVRVFVPEHLIK